jgi:hypothetical protein
MKHPHSCRGWADRDGPCGAGDCYTCHPEWQGVVAESATTDYETDPASEDEDGEHEEREEDE